MFLGWGNVVRPSDLIYRHVYVRDRANDLQLDENRLCPWPSLATPAPQPVAPVTSALNEAMDRFIQAVLAANLDVTIMNYSRGHLGFDTRDDSARTRAIVAATIAFVRASLAVRG